MKKLSLVAMVAIAALSFQACNNASKKGGGSSDSTSSTTSDTTAQSSTANGAASTDTAGKGSTAGGATNEMDTKFANDAAVSGMAEVAAGKVASQKATNPQVKDFAKMMVMDHTKANEELMAIAKKKNITLPTAPDADHQKMLTDLSTKTGKDFDKAYVDAMVNGHKKVASMLEDASKNCKDSELMGFAAKTLPTVKAHLAKIEAIQKAM
jgi:putative membrane protein